ncbi:lysophospholipase L1-like esterase [Arthrobacter sp. PvP023]|uniref:SGNH/GDSL hydrolase family protein n=1 Tax=Micrococcaceae TaxID=1268 RepID=UPI001AE8CD76|nr:SGNH/GDSL hydrolase family protein [Arthrobacter sp. PvP023]MBP1135119.1 lysophospholipase L1-like esterase [Arthrobacter sp. PvP023]
MGVLDQPARTQRQKYNALMPLRETCNTEGTPFSGGSSTVNATYTTDGSVSAGFTSPGVTRAFVVDTVTVTCNRSARLQIPLYETGIGGNDQQTWTVQVTPGTPVIIPVNAIIRPAVTGPSGGSTGSVRIREIYDGGSLTGVNLFAYVSGWSIADDFDYSADKVYLHIGDSITAAGTGVTAKSFEYDWLTLAYWKDKGIWVRMINKSVSGSTSVMHESRRLLGAYDFPQADVIGYSLGMNDAGQAVPVATYKTNVKNMIAWKQARYPAAKMIVYGATPAENNTTETALVALRTAASQAVTEANDPRVVYCNLGTAFDRTVASNYAGSDTPGSRVRPSNAGHAGIYAVIKTYLVANPNIKP